MAHAEDPIDIEITTGDWADMVEEQNKELNEILTSSHPAAEFLRSMFSEGFLESKMAETEQYVADLRGEDDADAVQE